jgi:UDP:flavonoid glycosyltransferase YjiC (YdhE family)
MRVYFAPCGIGLGHVGRTVPIAKELLKAKAEVAFSTYRDGVRYIENENLPLVKAPPIGFQVNQDGSIDFRQTAVNPGPFFSSFTVLNQVNSEIRFIGGFGPDVVVSDSRVSSLLAARMLGVPRVCILNQFQVIIPRRKHHLSLARFADSVTLTLVGKMWTSGNTVMIPDFPPPYTISVGNLNIPKSYRKNIRLIGPILAVHPDELETEEDLRRKLRLPADKPIVFAPISGSIKEKAFLTGILRKILLEFPEDYEVVMSLGYPGTDDRPERHGNVTIYKWITNRFEYLKACDVVIGRPGHGTITQAMCYGKPVILIPTPGHTEQINNAKQAQDLGVAKIIPQKELSRERLLRCVRQTLESDAPKRLKAIQKEVRECSGLRNAVEIIRAMVRN